MCRQAWGPILLFYLHWPCCSLPCLEIVALVCIDCSCTLRGSCYRRSCSFYLTSRLQPPASDMCFPRVTDCGKRPHMAARMSSSWGAHISSFYSHLLCCYFGCLKIPDSCALVVGEHCISIATTVLAGSTYYAFAASGQRYVSFW